MDTYETKIQGAKYGKFSTASNVNMGGSRKGAFGGFVEILMPNAKSGGYPRWAAEIILGGFSNPYFLHFGGYNPILDL